MKPWILLLVLAASCCTAFADDIDPTIILRPGLLSQPESGAFSFILEQSSSSPCTQPGAPGSSSPFTCDFVNESGFTWSSLLVEVAGTPHGHHNGNVKCPKAGDATNAPLTNCVVETATSLLFFNGPGIPDGKDFMLVFGKNSVDFFLTGTEVTVTPNVPEPATFALLGTGLVAGWVRRRARRTC
ncbi:MAG: PEP-CTERM sorting domain-containing protein [Acidobacteriaceae bacterium]|nr:PEP-CTERM sorting domain-containing protein [Acidobacteriaceae bacterium]